MRSHTAAYSLYEIELLLIYFFFFFQAEDGIRDGHVTGVQTCALPISLAAASAEAEAAQHDIEEASELGDHKAMAAAYKRLSRAEVNVARLEDGKTQRSEERRVGKECRCGWSAEHEKKK